MSEIVQGLQSVLARLEAGLKAAGRPKGAARLIAVSKTFPAECVQEAYGFGQRAFGENRVQELSEKAPKLPNDIEWHLIGHLQANKVRAALEHAAWIHSVDSLSLLKRVERIAAEMGVAPKVLLEVNVSGEESKFGLKPQDVAVLLDECPSKLLAGFMTVAPLGAPEKELHEIFGGLRELRDSMESRSGLKLPELSMGMSGDFEIALAEGATMIRVGTAIFGHRTTMINGE